MISVASYTLAPEHGRESLTLSNLVLGNLLVASLWLPNQEFTNLQLCVGDCRSAHSCVGRPFDTFVQDVFTPTVAVRRVDVSHSALVPNIRMIIAFERFDD